MTTLRTRQRGCNCIRPDGHVSNKNYSVGRMTTGGTAHLNRTRIPSPAMKSLLIAKTKTGPSPSILGGGLLLIIIPPPLPPRPPSSPQY